MAKFNGVTSFNGKSIEATCREGWGEHGAWELVNDKNEYMLIDNSEEYDQTQEESLEYLLSQAKEDGREDSNEFEGYIREIFEHDWQTRGSNDDVVKLCLQYVRYNDENEKEDKVMLNLLTSQLAASIEQLAAGLRNDIFDYDTFQFDIGNMGRKQWNSLSVQLDIIRQRLNVYAKLRSGEKFGMSWNNDTYFEAVKGTATEAKVRRILNRE